MSIKEKIAQYYLTFIIFSFIFSKKLVFIPFILDIKIKNRFLLDVAQLFFEPINLAIFPFKYILAASGSMMMLMIMGLFVFLIGLILLIIESFLLSKFIIFIFKKAAPENFFKNIYFIVRKKIRDGYANRYGDSENSKKFEKIKYLFPVIFFIIMVIVLYPIVSNLSNKEEKDRKKQNDSLYGQADRIDDKIDGDGDGLGDKVEFILGIDRYSKDSDGDGFSDYDELKNGHNPFLISPQDELTSETQIEIQEVLFSGEEINFSRLKNIRDGLEKQISEKLCQNNSSFYEDLSDKDKARDSIKLKNPCMCSKVINIKDRNDCFSVLGALVNDESLCSYISEEGREEKNGFYFKSKKDECFRNLMSVTLDEKYCFKISKESRITSCLIALILKTKRYDLCDSVENLDERDECYWTVAIFSKNKKLCDKISPDNKSGNDREGCIGLIKKSPL
ncbi:MAG: hypothetical protein KAI84_02070 [Gammaproteobacteria bacterium]|nr:hypothetical protein [Gammaproteobacteria bacterium]